MLRLCPQEELLRARPARDFGTSGHKRGIEGDSRRKAVTEPSPWVSLLHEP